MPDLEVLNTLSSLFEEAQKIKEYDDLNNKFYTLKIKILNKQKITESEEKGLFRIIQTNWKRIINDKNTELKEKIRKTKGQNFSANIREIDKIREEGEKDLDIDKYYEFFVMLINIEKDIDAKITIAKYQIHQDWKILIIGLIAGFILGIIGTIIVQKFHI